MAFIYDALLNPVPTVYWFTVFYKKILEFVNKTLRGYLESIEDINELRTPLKSAA